jgi:enoyl-CoA hydratase
VKVVIMAADGPHFSSGHHLGDRSQVGDHGRPVMGVGGYDLPGAEGWMAQEQEIYLGFCWRWRNLPKPTIVQVQGKAIAGGLMDGVGGRRRRHDLFPGPVHGIFRAHRRGPCRTVPAA